MPHLLCALEHKKVADFDLAFLLQNKLTSIAKDKNMPKKDLEVSPGLEPGLPEENEISESGVLTTRLRDLIGGCNLAFFVVKKPVRKWRTAHYLSTESWSKLRGVRPRPAQHHGVPFALLRNLKNGTSFNRGNDRNIQWEFQIY